MASLKQTAARGWAELVVRVGNAGRANGLTLADAIADLARGGMSPANIEATLLADLNAGGRTYFGPMLKGIREASLKGVDMAVDAIEMVAYDDKLKAANAALSGGDLKKAQEAIRGVTKADLGATGPQMLQAWVTVMDGNECPDCGPRHGMVLTEAEWAQVGKPRWGTTVCREFCRCKLVPAAAAASDGALRDDLKDPLTVPRAGKKVKV